jgi:leucyl/phenylalanyl-tRNA--protein transferase
MTIYLPELTDDIDVFPHPNSAMHDPNGLLAFGGDLSPERLLSAYQQGIFPWYNPGEPILWWSPAPRAIFNPATYQPSKSLKKMARQRHYQVTLNQAFDRVINKCANTRGSQHTWISEEIQQAYCNLHRQGHCHSVEVWLDGNLVGGLYGVGVGQIFCGESMFALENNASKLAFWFFCRHFSQHQGKLIDAQVMNNHLASLGAITLPRSQFLSHLQEFKIEAVSDACYHPQTLSYSQ